MKTTLKLALIVVALSLAGCAQTTPCGYPIVGGSFFSGQNNLEVTSTGCVAPNNSSVTNCQLYIGTATGTIGCAIVDSDGAAGCGLGNCPKTVLCQGTIPIPTNGAWNTIPLSGCPALTTGHAYYLAENVSSAGATITGDTAVGGSFNALYFAQACCTFINYGAYTTGGGVQAVSIYLNLSQTDTIVCGTTAVGTFLGGALNTIYGTARCIPLVNTTALDCKVYTAFTGHLFGCAIYDSDGAGGIPKTVLCQGTATSAGVGFFTVPISGCGVLTAGHLYYIATNADGTNIQQTTNTGLTYGFSSACCTFPAFSVSPSISDAAVAVYLDLASLSHHRAQVMAGE